MLHKKLRRDKKKNRKRGKRKKKGKGMSHELLTYGRIDLTANTLMCLSCYCLIKGQERRILFPVSVIQDRKRVEGLDSITGFTSPFLSCEQERNRIQSQDKDLSLEMNVDLPLTLSHHTFLSLSLFSLFSLFALFALFVLFLLGLVPW